MQTVNVHGNTVKTKFRKKEFPYFLIIFFFSFFFSFSLTFFFLSFVFFNFCFYGVALPYWLFKKIPDQQDKQGIFSPLFSFSKTFGFSFLRKLRQNCPILSKWIRLLRVDLRRKAQIVECGCYHYPGAGIGEISVTLGRFPVLCLECFVLGTVNPRGCTSCNCSLSWK